MNPMKGLSIYKTMRVPCLILASFFLGASSARAAELLPLGHAELLRSYSEIRKGSNNSGFDLSGYYSPIIKFNDTLFLIPLYSVKFQEVAQYLPQEEGNVFFNTYLVHNFDLCLRKEFKPGWFLKFGPLGTWNFTRETHEDNWGTGLYDYRDAGFITEIKRQTTREDVVSVYLAAFEYYRRQYPNFATLITSTTVTPPERREKDYDGYKWKLRAEGASADGLRWYAEGHLLNKYFLDKHQVLEDGSLDLGSHRQDYEISMNAGLTHPLPWNGFSVFLDGDATTDQSHAGYYDSRNTLSLADDVFTKRYYAYNSFSIGPAFEYAYPIAKEKILRLRLGYHCLYRAYTHRKSQDISGNYLNDNEADTEQEYSALLSFPLTPKIKWVIRYSFLHALSTQKYEEYYRYNYDSYQIKTGIDFDF
jgi:hypothetical protein